MNFIVKGQKLTRIDSDVIVADAKNYYSATVAFSAEWLSLTKYIHFVRGATHYSHELLSDSLPAAAGVVLTSGDWQVSITGDLMGGEDLAERITTNAVIIPVGMSNGVDGDAFPAFGGDIGARILASEEARGTAEEGRVAAELLRVADEAARASFTDFSTDVSYVKGQKVYHAADGCSYIWTLETASVAGTAPPATGWQKITQKGDAGADITTSSELPLVDAGEYYDSSTPEGALQEVGSRLADITNNLGGLSFAVGEDGGLDITYTY